MQFLGPNPGDIKTSGSGSVRQAAALLRQTRTSHDKEVI